MMEATAQKGQVGQMKRVAENIKKERQPELKAPPNTKAIEWASRNPWFNRDMVMTNVAYTIHDDIVRGGPNKSRKVRLTPSQVAVANRLGVSLEDYAKEYVALSSS
jgi:hypothetical protein